MILVNAYYKVTVTTEYAPFPKEHAVLYRPDGLRSDDFCSARLIHVEPTDGRTFSVALQDSVLSSAEPCAVLEDGMLTVILYHTILRIDLHTLAVAQCIECENPGGLEQIHPLPRGYLIKGECDLFRYDRALRPVWHFDVGELLASPTGKECFWLEGGMIHCRSWDGRHYILDMNGNIRSNTAENSLGR